MLKFILDHDKNVISFCFNTKIGLIELKGTDNSLHSLSFIKSKTPSSTQKSELLYYVHQQLLEYLDKKRQIFDVQIAIQGTTFQQQVWKELSKIPFGKTVSYGNIAQKIGNPNASRAVGMANNKNPVAIIVPCHRVIGTSGKLIGYAGGLDIKENLLHLEEIKFKK